LKESCRLPPAVAISPMLELAMAIAFIRSIIGGVFVADLN
jgi:hypothetical protein